MDRRNALTFQYIPALAVPYRVPPDTAFAFLHIPRSGGTTLKNILRLAAEVSGRSMTQVLGTVLGQYLGDGKAEADAELSELSLDNKTIAVGHFTWSGIEQLPKPNIVATLLRDPVERMASQFLFGASRGGWASDTPLRDVIERGAIIDNLQTRIFAGLTDTTQQVDEAACELARRHLAQCKLAGDLRKFELFCGALLGAFGLPDVVCAVSNARSGDVAMPGDPDFVSQAQEYSKHDYELFRGVQSGLQMSGEALTPTELRSNSRQVCIILPKLRKGDTLRVIQSDDTQAENIEAFLRQHYPDHSVTLQKPSCA